MEGALEDTDRATRLGDLQDQILEAEKGILSSKNRMKARKAGERSMKARPCLAMWRKDRMIMRARRRADKIVLHQVQEQKRADRGRLRAVCQSHRTNGEQVWCVRRMGLPLYVHLQLSL